MKYILATTLLLTTLPALASKDFDAAHFIQTKCSSCHNAQVYTRPDHRMQNRQQLEAQVRRCDANVGTSLFDEDIHAVVDYLDRKYYRFDQ